MLKKKMRKKIKVLISSALCLGTAFCPCITHAMEVESIALFNKRYQAINAQDAKGRTALHRACKYQHLDDVQLFLKSGAKTDIVDKNGNTPLHIACNMSPGGSKKILIIKELIKAHAPINALNIWQQTPLHLAASSWYKTGIQFLIDHGALINIEDHAGATPLDHAVILDAPPINIRVLLDAGASISGKPIGLPYGQSMHWCYPRETGCTLFHYDIFFDNESAQTLIRHPRTMTRQDKLIAQTLLMIHRFRKESWLAHIPKDLLVRHILPHCVTNFYYSFGTIRQRIDWHIAELERFFLQKNSRGFTPYEYSDEECELLIPEKVNQQHRKDIVRNYRKASLRKLSRMTFKLGHNTLTP